tara:strand:+ start:380 stop:1825 length:1446 start_codon:yes stop_codon:yes gene_type:complete
MDEFDDLISGDKGMDEPKKPAPKKSVTKKTPAKKKEQPKDTSTRRVKKKVADLDRNSKRRLNKKSKETLRSRWNQKNSAVSRDGMMGQLLNSARDKFGSDRIFGSREELEQLCVGVPTPSLAFEYLVANDIFPLQSVMMLAGSWGTCKSALSYEFFRWIYELSGVNVHIDTEDKFDGEFASDIMRVPHGVNPIISSRANSLEQMQQMLTHYLQQVQKSLIGTKENPGPGKVVPCCFTIDSLAAAASEENQEKILKAGNAGRAHPVEALKNTGYLKSIKKQFEGWPFTLLIVNHLKEKTDDMGRSHKYTLGGEAFNFHESFQLENTVWKTKFKNSKFSGIGIRIKCSKNSFGPTGRQIRTRFLWWVEDDPETGAPRDVFLWDWNWAMCTLLNEVEGQEKTRLQSRGIDIKCKSPAADIDCLANLTCLGMGKDEYLPFQEVGQMIQDNEEVSELIRDALNIKRRYHLDRPFDEIEQDYKDSVE